MKREEFETILKRALELQGHQLSREEDPLTEQDLASAAQRLKIPPEIMHQAFLEVRRSRKQFRVKGTPEEVREAFLRNFLLQTTQHVTQILPLRVDRQALQIGRSTTVRVQDPSFLEIDAEVSFTADGAEHTLVSWVGNSSLSWRSTFFVSAIPLLVLAIMVGPLILSGAAFSAWLSSLIIPSIILFVMFWAFRQQTKRVDAILAEYFENIQILGDLKENKAAEQELLELRAWKEKMSIVSSPIAAPFLSEENPSSEESDERTENLPPQPQANRES